MKRGTIGILAGMGPKSTAPFIDLVVEECRHAYGARDDMDFPHMLIYSLPTPFYADRTPDRAAMVKALRNGLGRLERGGADFAAIACSTAHIYYEELAGKTGLPLFDMVDLALDELGPARGKTALLAARATAEAGVYQAGLLRRGHKPADPGWQALVDGMLEGLRAGAAPEFFADRWRELGLLAKAAEVENVIIACMDLSATLPRLGGGIRAVDAGSCLARALVKKWGTWRGPDRDDIRWRPQICWR